MEIKDLIRLYPSGLPDTFLNNFFRWLKQHPDFQSAGVLKDSGKNVINKNIRKTDCLVLDNCHPSYTNVYFYNIMHLVIKNSLDRYKKDCNLVDFPLDKIITINALKYTDNGFYSFHTDHCLHAPRTMTFLFFVNDEYEGGELEIAQPDKSESLILRPKKGSVLLFPSNFIFPHRVKPVTHGERFTIVSWAL